MSARSSWQHHIPTSPRSAQSQAAALPQTAAVCPPQGHSGMSHLVAAAEQGVTHSSWALRRADLKDVRQRPESSQAWP